MHPYSRQTINQLLAEMDGFVFLTRTFSELLDVNDIWPRRTFVDVIFYRFKPNEGVIVVGATNFAEALDKYVHI